jgi:hypothetical protein
MGTTNIKNRDFSSLVDRVVNLTINSPFLELEHNEDEQHLKYLVPYKKGTVIRGILREVDKHYLKIDLLNRGIGGAYSISALSLTEQKGDGVQKEGCEEYPAVNLLLDCIRSAEGRTSTKKLNSNLVQINMNKNGYFAVIGNEYVKRIKS